MRVFADETFRGFCTYPPFAPFLVSAADKAQLQKWLWNIRLWELIIDVATDDLGPFNVEAVFKDGTVEVKGGEETDRYPVETKKVCAFNTYYAQGAPEPLVIVSMGFTGIQNESTNLLECQVDFDYNGITFTNGTGAPTQPFVFTAYLDGQPFSCQSSLPLTTANVTINPYTGGNGFWEYRRNDGTVPLFNGETGAALFPPGDPEYLYGMKVPSIVS